MKIFNIENTVDLLKSKSDKIINVFTQTIEDLSNVNNLINDEIKIRENRIETIKQEHSSLSDNLSNNQEMIDKIKNFINE